MLNNSLEGLLVTNTAVVGCLKLSKEEGGGRGCPRVFLVRVLVVAVELLAPIVEVGLGGVGAVLVVEDLAGQAVGGHALLGGHFVGAHLQRDGGGVTVLQLQLLVKDVPPGSWGCHASLGHREQDEGVLQKNNKKTKTFYR